MCKEFSTIKESPGNRSQLKKMKSLCLQFLGALITFPLTEPSVNMNLVFVTYLFYYFIKSVHVIANAIMQFCFANF